MQNRRNLYRILHVQPEAPLEIIKASYRSLMTKLKLHPDLGGDHEAAVLINQAYAVLGDPERRRRYDDLLRRQGPPPAGPGARQTRADAARAGGKVHAYRQHATSAASNEASPVCLFCGFACALGTPVPQLCSACRAPLHPPRAGRGRPQVELFGRRTSPRIARSAELLVYPDWPHAGLRARLRDLSVDGISFACDFAPEVGARLLIASSLLRGVMQVASVRHQQARRTVHGPLLRVQFARSSGAFVQERA